ncbi:MAG: hypothetical protein ACFB13_19550 [Kiloniellaceae bacterium]
MQKLLVAAFWLCLLSLPITVAAASAEGRPIEGHQNLRLGMTLAEAEAAEPRAQPDGNCPDGTCLGYFDRRFLSTGYQVLAVFGADDSLHSIALSMLMAQGEASCRRQLGTAARDFTRSYGAPDSTADGISTWHDSTAAIVLTDGCAAAGGSTIAITINSQPR